MPDHRIGTLIQRVTQRRIVRTTALAVLLFCLTGALYSLAYSGSTSSDDEQLFISTARNIAVMGEMSAGQLSGNIRLMGDFHVEPAHPWMASLVYKVLLLTGFSRVQGLMLLSLLYSACSAALVFGLARQQGYSDQVSLAAALAFSFSTIAFVYAQTFYREVLAMLALLAAWYALERGIASVDKRVSSAWFAVWVLSFTFCLLTKMLLVVALPAFLFRLGEFLYAQGGARRTFRVFAWSLGSLGLAAVLYLSLTLAVPEDQVLYRFSGALVRDGWNRMWGLERNVSWLANLAGQLFSPGKGFFLYSPVCLLSLPALFARRQPESAGQRILPWFVLLGLAAAQWLAYGDEWFSISWSTRHLLPAVPLMVVAALPFFKQVVEGGGQYRRSVFWVLIWLGLAAQLGGVLVSPPWYGAAYTDLNGVPLSNAVMWQLDHFPLIGHWRAVFSGADLQPLVIRMWSASALGSILILLLGIGVAVGSAWTIRRVLENEGEGNQLGFSQLAPVVLGALLLPMVILSLGRADPRTESGRGDLRDSLASIMEESQNGDMVVIQSYLHPAWTYWMHHDPGKLPWFSLPLMVEADDAERLKLVEDLLARAAERKWTRLWLVQEMWFEDGYIPLEENFLRQNYPLAEEMAFGGEEGRARVLLFDLAGLPPPDSGTE